MLMKEIQVWAKLDHLCKFIELYNNTLQLYSIEY